MRLGQQQAKYFRIDLRNPLGPLILRRFLHPSVIQMQLQKSAARAHQNSSKRKTGAARRQIGALHSEPPPKSPSIEKFAAVWNETEAEEPVEIRFFPFLSCCRRLRIENNRQLSRRKRALFLRQEKRRMG